MSEKRPLFARYGVVGWRRSNLWEASQNSARVFAFFNIFIVLLTALIGSDPQYAMAFRSSLALGIVFGAISILIPTKPVFFDE
ncbi:MAG: hypothetical protein ABGW87_05635 [Sphingomonadaceae bacterium]